MQNMTDTHDHGPPTTIAAKCRSDLARHSLSLSPYHVNLISGASAGAASAILTCPLDVVKTRLQAQGAYARRDLTPTNLGLRGMFESIRTKAFRFEFVKSILRQDGVRGFYRGLAPMMMGYLPTWGIYMMVYDFNKGWMNNRGYTSTANSKYFAHLACAVSAGACSTLVTNPIWVVKTRFMSQVSRTVPLGPRTPWHYTSTLDAFQKMYRSEGIGAFYSGLAPAMLGLTHVAIQFPLYEHLKERFTGLEMGERSHEKEDTWELQLGILGATVLSKVCATTITYPHEVLRTRLQTQQRHYSPEGSHDGVASSHHSQGVSTSKRVGNSDGSVYRPRYQGLVHTFRVIVREEGWSALYSGVGTNMFRAVPAAVVTMYTYERVKSMIEEMRETGKELAANEA